MSDKRHPKNPVARRSHQVSREEGVKAQFDTSVRALGKDNKVHCTFTCQRKCYGHWRKTHHATKSTPNHKP